MDSRDLLQPNSSDKSEAFPIDHGYNLEVSWANLAFTQTDHCWVIEKNAGDINSTDEISFWAVERAYTNVVCLTAINGGRFATAVRNREK